MRMPARLVSGLPSLFWVGGVTVTAAVPVVAGAVTVMAKAGSALDACPSLTLMMMLPKVPVCTLVGVPDNVPLAILKLAHAGLFCTENDSVVPLGPLAAGWNE